MTPCPICTFGLRLVCVKKTFYGKRRMVTKSFVSMTKIGNSRELPIFVLYATCDGNPSYNMPNWRIYSLLIGPPDHMMARRIATRTLVMLNNNSGAYGLPALSTTMARISRGGSKLIGKS